jgi:hypothetical protein
MPDVQLYGTPVESLEFRTAASIVKHSAVTTGRVHSLTVPRKPTQRFIWLAYDSMRAGDEVPWYMDGRVVFWLNSTKITELPINAGNSFAPGRSLNVFAPKTGSGMQPPLRATALDSYRQYGYQSSWTKDRTSSVDMPCFAFNVECDLITLEIDAMSLGATYLTWKKFEVYRSITTVGVNQTTLDNASSGLKFTINGGGSGIGPYKSLVTIDDTLTSIYKMDSDLACELGNAYYPTLAVLPTNVQINYTGVGTLGGAPGFYIEMDGKADLITGLVVASQYPGGL